MRKRVFFPCFYIFLFLCMFLFLCPGISLRTSASSGKASSDPKISYQNTFRTVKGKIYYYNGKGKKVKNKWKTIDNKKYYFYPDGHAATGFCTIRKKKYCFTSKGVMRTGWYTKSGKTYYFKPKNGVMTTGEKIISGKQYHFKSSGIMVTDDWVNGKYYDKNGVYDASKKEVLTDLKKKLQKAVKGYSGTWSIYVKNLDTNESICINNKKMYAASLIKLYAMAAAYERIDQKKLSETSYVRNTIHSMISVSDNYSFNDLVRRIGKTYINSWCKENGYSDTRQYHGLSPSGNTAGLRTSSSSNVTSVKDCGILLESIYRKTCVSKSASQKMLAHLKAQERRYKIPAGIPSGVTVANKTGETNDTTHDAAIVYSKGADYIICVMATCPGYAWNSAHNVTKISRIVYSYFN